MSVNIRDHGQIGQFLNKEVSYHDHKVTGCDVCRLVEADNETNLAF